MKKSFMTRALATGLSLAMAFSLSAATNVSVASAAAKPAMKSETMTVKVGQSKNYQATAATQKAYKITAIKMSAAGKTKATVKINDSKKSIKVTGLAATKGSNVVVTFKNNSTKKTSKVTTKVVVKAEAPKVAELTEVAQVSATKLTATLAIPVEKAAIEDVKIIRDENNAVIAVKSVALDATDKTKLTIETYADLTDGKAYTVTYTAQTEDKTESSKPFTATDGTVADFALSTTSITANKATEIKYSALDAKGVVIYEKTIDKKDTNIDITVTCDNGYQDGAQLVLVNAGNTAKIAITYHTYKYDAEGNETDMIKKEFTVTAVDASTTVSNFVYTIIKSGDEPAWENLTANTKLAMGENNKVAWFKIKDSNGVDVTSTCGYTVESSNNNVLLVSPADGVKREVALRPVAEGSAYLILKDGSKTVATLPVTVVAKRVLASFTLDKSSVSIATTAAAGAPEATFIGYTAKDQYGDNISLDNLDIDCKAKPSGATANIPVTTEVRASKKITIDTNNNEVVKGTYTFTATAKVGDKSQTKSFTVNVVSPSTSGDYVLQFVNGSSVDGTNVITSMDTTVNQWNKDGNSISVNIAKRQNGVIVGGLDLSNPATVSVSSIKVVGSNGKTYVSAKVGDPTHATTSAAINDDITANAFDTDDAAKANGKLFVIDVVSATTVDSAQHLVKNLPAGSYTVTVELKELVNRKIVTRTAVNSFKITDSQPALTATVLKTSTDETTLKNVIENKDFVKFVYGGVTQIKSDLSTVKYVGTSDSSTLGKNYVVKNVTVAVPVPGADGYYVQMTAPINRVFTTSGDRWS